MAACNRLGIPPFLWMPDGSGGTVQPGPELSQGAGSAHYGHKSVHKLRGLVSLPQKTSNGSQASDVQTTAHVHNEDDNRNVPACSSKSHSRFKPVQKQQRHDENKRQPASQLRQPDMTSSALAQEQQHHQQLQPQQQHASCLNKAHAQAGLFCQQANGGHQVAEQQQQQASATYPARNASVHASPCREHHNRLTGVRLVPHGWQARLGGGRTRAKHSLGIYPTGKVTTASICCISHKSERHAVQHMLHRL